MPKHFSGRSRLSFLFGLCGVIATLGCSSEDSNPGTGGSGGAAGASTAGSGGSSGGSGGSGGTSGTTGGSGGTAGTDGTGGTTQTGGSGAGTDAAVDAGGSSGNGGSVAVDSGPDGVTRAEGGAADAAREANVASEGGRGDGGACGGFAVSLGSNTAMNSDPAKARVVVDFAGSADLPTGNTPRTIEFWAFVRTSSWVADANTFFFYGANSRARPDGFGLDFASSAGTMGRIDVFTNTVYDKDDQPSGLMNNMDQWAHFAMTWDGAAVRAFVNGVERATSISNPPNVPLATAASPLTIGGFDPAYFNGMFDEFRIWNVAHDAAAITSTMRTPLVGNEPGLTAYYKFDEGTGTVANDSVSSAGHTKHNGTLMATSAALLPTWAAGAPLNCP